MKDLLNYSGRAIAGYRKTHYALVVALGIAALMLVVAPGGVPGQSGGSFDLSWNSIDGGGQRSAGGAFVLDGSIGQPDADVVMTGGSFALRGGFFAFSGPAQTASSDWTLYE